MCEYVDGMACLCEYVDGMACLCMNIVMGWHVCV